MASLFEPSCRSVHSQCDQVWRLIIPNARLSTECIRGGDILFPENFEISVLKSHILVHSDTF